MLIVTITHNYICGRSGSCAEPIWFALRGADPGVGTIDLNTVNEIPLVTRSTNLPVSMISESKHGV